MPPSRRTPATREAKPPEYSSWWNYLLASDETVRKEILGAEREARRAFESESDRQSWLELEREVREHRRWRHLAWALVFGPAAAVIVWFVVSSLLGALLAP